MTITAIVSGLSTAGALLIASYTIVHTPYLSDIPIYRDGALKTVQSKWTQLFAPVFMPCLILSWSIFNSIRWTAFQRMIESAHRARLEEARKLYLLVCSTVMGFEIILLIFVAGISRHIMGL